MAYESSMRFVQYGTCLSTMKAAMYCGEEYNEGRAASEDTDHAQLSSVVDAFPGHP